jgi:hypothetical protein
MWVASTQSSVDTAGSLRFRSSFPSLDRFFSQPLHLFSQFGKRGSSGFRANKKNDVDPMPWSPVRPYSLADPPFLAVTPGMAPCPFGRSDPCQALTGKAVRPGRLPIHPQSIREQFVEPAFGRAPQAASRRLPLVRRRFNTFCPSVVRILIRKPWVLLRLRLLG